MSRPLIFFLQLLGLIIFLSAVSKDPANYTNAVIGIALAITGGIGYRRRKQEGNK